jgi:hypothetical protein
LAFRPAEPILSDATASAGGAAFHDLNDRLPNAGILRSGAAKMVVVRLGTDGPAAR